MCNTPSVAEDMLQETFIKAFQNIGNLKDKNKFSSWIFQIASNNCLMGKRKDSRQKTISIDESFVINDGKSFYYEIADPHADPLKEYERKELKDILDKALAELPEIYRDVFILKDVEGFKAHEIADILNISLPNVKARVLRARLKLQERLHQTLKHNEGDIGA